jgi:hypothetical protein
MSGELRCRRCDARLPVSGPTSPSHVECTVCGDLNDLSSGAAPGPRSEPQSGPSDPSARPSPQRLPLGTFLGTPIAAVLVSWVLIVLGFIALEEEGGFGAFLFFFAAVVLYAYAIVIGCMLWYRAWASIQDGHVRTTPARAVGFSFIPFFNFYWIFQMTYGFAQDYNSYVKRHDLGVGGLSEGLYLTNCILTLGTCIPYLGMLAVLPVLVISIITTVMTCNAVNALPLVPATGEE